MYRKKKVIIITMCVAIFLMAVGYAAFSANLKINGTASVTSIWQILFTNIEEVSKTDGVTIISSPTASGTTATFNVGLELPGDSIEYKITVENQGTVDAIINDIVASETGSDAIKFEIENIKEGDILSKESSTTFNITISYDINVASQPTFTDNELSITINYMQYTGQSITSTPPTIDVSLLSRKILQDNVAQADTNIDFSKTSEEAGTKGLYYTSTNTEDNKTTYYFRGSVTNNYVKMGTRTSNTCKYNGVDVAYIDMTNFIFNYSPTQTECTSTNVCTGGLLGNIVGVDSYTCENRGGTMTSSKATYTTNVTEDILWRVVRINEDGSIRLVTEKNMGSSAFNTNYSDNAYVGYMYGATGASTYAATHANTNNSAIKDYLDDWYVDNLSSYASIIADAGFCNDRSIYIGNGFANNSATYGSYNRIAELFKPQFACPQSSDLFTTSTSSKGNKALDYPIGLLTADELIYAGEVAYGLNNNPYYLNNGTLYWTMSPYASDEWDTSAWFINLQLSLVATGVYRVVGVRPAINLVSNVEITGGDGTSTNPYVVKTN